MIAIVAALVVIFGSGALAHAGSLQDAVRDGDLEQVRTLIGQGADVNERGRNAETPLIIAALAGEAPVAEFLIAQGADVMARNGGGLTPLHAAAYAGSVEVAQLLLDHRAELEDRANFSGATPLMLAAEENHVDVAELLIVRGADLSIPDRDGFTPLTQAWAKKRTEMVRLLKRHGAICQSAEFLGSEDYYRRCVEAGT
jgi:uncharacterized protein